MAKQKITEEQIKSWSESLERIDASCRALFAEQIANGWDSPEMVEGLKLLIRQQNQLAQYLADERRRARGVL